MYEEAWKCAELIGRTGKQWQTIESQAEDMQQKPTVFFVFADIRIATTWRGSLNQRPCDAGTGISRQRDTSFDAENSAKTVAPESHISSLRSLRLIMW